MKYVVQQHIISLQEVEASSSSEAKDKFDPSRAVTTSISYNMYEDCILKNGRVYYIGRKEDDSCILP